MYPGKVFFLLLQNSLNMKTFTSYIRPDSFLLVFILILIPPALFLNLGLMPFILDEATRANVAMEMMLSGNYFVPTINGEFYYNKPPLFNWIQILFVQITGRADEFSFRLPVVISLLLFCVTVYKTQKSVSDRSTAFLSAMAVLSCGRILFYDSFRGLIDISFSWLVYLIFWSVYKFFQERRYLSLFLWVYILTFAGFLMKGLPVLVFTGISLITVFLYGRKFRRLFSWQHMLSFFLLTGLLSAYLYMYSKTNSPDHYFSTLWSESSKRTFIDNSLWDSVKHLFLFPFDFMFHFLPWTLLLLVFLFRKPRQAVWNDSFGRISLLLFLTNILVYWVSPAIYPRYLFMFLPLVFYTGFRGISVFRAGFKERTYPSLLLRMASFLLLATLLILPFFVDQEIYGNFYLKYFVSLVPAIPIVYLIFSRRGNAFLLIIASLLVIRIAFNVFVLPDRLDKSTFLKEKNGAILAGKISQGEPLYLLHETRIHHASSFYLMQTRGDILKTREEAPLPGQLYIAESDQLGELEDSRVIYSFPTRINNLQLYLVRIGQATE